MTGKKDLLRPALEEIIDLGHPLVRLAAQIDSPGPVQPAARSRGQEPAPAKAGVSVQDHRQRGPEVYSLHAPEVECIGTVGGTYRRDRELLAETAHDLMDFRFALRHAAA